MTRRRKDGRPSLNTKRRLCHADTIAEDMALLARWPAESYADLAESTGLDRWTVHGRIRRMRQFLADNPPRDGIPPTPMPYPKPTRSPPRPAKRKLIGYAGKEKEV